MYCPVDERDTMVSVVVGVVVGVNREEHKEACGQRHGHRRLPQQAQGDEWRGVPEKVHKGTRRIRSCQ